MLDADYADPWAYGLIITEKILAYQFFHSAYSIYESIKTGFWMNFIRETCFLHPSADGAAKSLVEQSRLWRRVNLSAEQAGTPLLCGGNWVLGLPWGSYP